MFLVGVLRILEATVFVPLGRTLLVLRATSHQEGVNSRPHHGCSVASVPIVSRPDLCQELLEVTVDPVPEGGCQACIEKGDTWVHLRFCVTCRLVGCCDDSKNRHARKHAADGHPVVRSKEPGEYWAYCFDHDAGRTLRSPVD